MMGMGFRKQMYVFASILQCLFYFFLRMRVLAGRCWLGRGISFLMSFFHVGVAIDEYHIVCGIFPGT